VPEPYYFGEDVLVMQLITGPDGSPAPRLFDVTPTRAQALSLHEYLIRQVVRMLCAGMVHGDLSEYNILMAEEGPVIIDLPQATDAAQNRNSERILLRDVKHLGQYLGRWAPKLRRMRYGKEIWHLYRQGELHPDSELTGRWSRQTEVVSTDSIIQEIQAAAADAAKTPVSGYRAKKERQRAEAQAAAAAAAAAAKQRKPKPKQKPKPKPKQQEPTAEASGDAPRRRRRRRRRRRGAGSSGGGT